MARLYIVGIASAGRTIYAGHFLAGDAAEARAKAASAYEAQRSPASVAKLRAVDGGAAMADIIEAFPHVTACAVTARLSKARNPADWIANDDGSVFQRPDSGETGRGPVN